MLSASELLLILQSEIRPIEERLDSALWQAIAGKQHYTHFGRLLGTETIVPIYDCNPGADSAPGCRQHLASCERRQATHAPYHFMGGHKRLW